jgi:RNA polymerase sigma-70 factor (ECF subfamily)
MSVFRAAPATNAEWLARIRAGDEAAFEALFRAFAPGLCAFVSNYVKSREPAEEIVQDLFLALWRMRASLHVESSLSTYLYQAARNRAFDWLKRERRLRKRDDGVAGAIDQLDPAAPTERELLDMLDLQDAIDRLPPRCRLIFTLSRQQGMSHAEISSALGLSVKTVEVQIGRALRALRPSHAKSDE